MSAKTRIKRPTSSTPRKAGSERMIWKSTDMHILALPDGSKEVKYNKGMTLRRPK